ETTIGSGYTSGRELWEFFGHESGLAITLFYILCTMSCYIIMVLSYQKQSSHYVPVLRMIVGKRLTGVYDFMIFLYLFTVTVVMIAGSGATGQVFQLSYWWGIAFIIIALILLFIKGINGLLMINQLILLLFIMGLFTVLLIFIYYEGLMFVFLWREKRIWMSSVSR